MALIIDVETTGLPKRDNLSYGQNPSYKNLEMYDSCRIVQISMMLCNKKFEEISFEDFIIKADDFSIGNSSFHGITDEISKNEGKSFSEVAEIVLTYVKKASHIVAHNANFDFPVLCSELYRHNLSNIIAELETKKILCTMKHTKLMVGAKNNYGIKYPSLAELYKFVIKEDIQNAHNSKYDVINLHKIVKALYDSERLSLDNLTL